MRNELITKEQLFSKMVEMSVDGKVESSKKAIANSIGLASASANAFVKYLKQLEDEGKIKLLEEGKNLGGGKWSNTIWEIVDLITEEAECIENSDIENINVENYVEEHFNNIVIKLYKTHKGYIIPMSNIYKALGLDKQLFSQMIKKNIKLFKPWLVNVVMTSRKSGNKNICLTRDGVIGVIMKISYYRLPEEKQELVLKFQKWAIEKLSVLLSDGKVELNEIEHLQIQSTMGNIIDMNEGQIDKLFNELDDTILKLIDTAKTTIRTIKTDRDKIEFEKESLKKVNQRLINSTLELKEKLLNTKLL